jgi:hypothetical protein
MEGTVTRYVVTHRGKDGIRTLAHACQGRCTYSTPQEAQAWIDAAIADNGEARLAEFFGLPLLVCPVECWPGHHDPVTIYT